MGTERWDVHARIWPVNAAFAWTVHGRDISRFQGQLSEGAALFLFSNSNGLSKADAARLHRVEQKLDLILEHLGIGAEPEPSDPGQWPVQIRRPADQGQKIEAIKAYREFFGSSLLEAKNAVEAYMNR
jgi:hypothetical protein